MQLTAAIAHGGDWCVARRLQVEVASRGETVEAAPANLQAPIIAPVELSVRAA